MQASFEEAYERLNPRQKEAVDAIEGPVMVIAGPGTGKTQILTLRVANILAKTDAKPSSILALTFTESAAANMRNRLTELIGTSGYYVQIATFHGFANDMIQQYPENFPAIIGGRNAAEVDQVEILRDIIQNGSAEGGQAFERVKPFGDPFYFVPDILSAIRSIKNEGLSPLQFSKLLAEEESRLKAQPDMYHEKGKYAGKLKGEYEKEFDTLARNRELAEVYRLYEEKLRVERLYDFEDMILSCIRAFESRPNFLLQVQERFQYFLVDEHQDTNGAQNRLLELLASYYDAPNLFVVGDEKQAIFRFQGASLENFLYFQRKYPSAQVIYLEQNYRSYQPILDSAGSLIEKNVAALKHELKAARGAGPEGKAATKGIEILALRTPEQERFAISEMVKQRLEAGLPPEEIAVLYRQNSDAAPIADMLARKGVPHVVESDRDVLADPDIRSILTLAEAVADFGDDAKLAEALHLDFLGFEPLEIYKLISGGTERREGEARESLYDRVMRTPLGPKLAKWKKDSVNKNFLDFFDELLQTSGYLEHLMSKPQAFEKVRALSALFKEMQRTVGEKGEYRLTDFVRHLEIIREHRIPIRGPAPATEGMVRLMTAHKAKGLEFDCVIIAGATDGHWGNRRNIGRFKLPFKTSVDQGIIEKNEDERRLFYMALTRARNEACITYARERDDGRAEVPSQFIGEIREDLRHEADGKAYEKHLEEERIALLAPKDTSLPLEAEQEFLRDLSRKRGLSVTALNAYLKCPWDYFYRNLLRVPSVMSLPQVYGSAVHGALESFFDAKKKGEGVGKEFLVDSFARELKRYPLVEKDMARVLEKGRTTLAAYYEQNAPTWNYKVVTELKVKVPLEVPASENSPAEAIMLSGVLDKVELLDAPGEVAVVDYKTRKPESRNWIEGKTANSTGDYKRQLIFYKLLLDASPELGYKMLRGEIDFVEPNERGVFKKEAFEISDAEVAELRETTAKVVREILDLSFWDRKCDDKKCEWCGLRRNFKRDGI